MLGERLMIGKRLFAVNALITETKKHLCFHIRNPLMIKRTYFFILSCKTSIYSFMKTRKEKRCRLEWHEGKEIKNYQGYLANPNSNDGRCTGDGSVWP